MSIEVYPAAMKIKNDDDYTPLMCIRGPKGDKGDKGDTGPKGDNGEVSPSDISASVNNWLENNFSQETTVIIDKSMTINGAAADARIVGKNQEMNTFYSGYRSLLFNAGYIDCNSSTVDKSNIHSSTSYEYVLIPCTAGDIFIINTLGAAAARPWCFIDDDGNRKSVMNVSGYLCQNEVVIAPIGATYFIGHNKNSTKTDEYIYQLSADKNINPVIVHHPIDDFIYGRINPNTGIWEWWNYFISTKSYLPDSYMLLKVKEGAQVCVILYNKDGTYNSESHWLTSTSKTPYVFDHAQYLYRFYVSYVPQKQVGSIKDLSSYLEFVVDANKYERDLQKSIGINDKALSGCLRTMKKGMPYNIFFANAPYPLNLKNHLGNTQNVHPKVLYFEEGFNGYKYWMSYTPYPMSFSYYENPCIAYSNDGYEWTNIENNPLDAVELDFGGYNSDANLVYNSDTNQLECWFRTSKPSPVTEDIKRCVSNDGFTWSEAETMTLPTIYSDRYTNFLSPAIIYDGTKYNIWVVNYKDKVIKYYTAPKNNTASTEWTFVRDINLTYNYNNFNEIYPWHIDVIKDGSQYILLVAARNGQELSSISCTFIATSNDNESYSTPIPVLVGSDGWDYWQYRASIVKVENQYRIYYSACKSVAGDSQTTQAVWGIGVTSSNTLNNFIGEVY